MKHEGYYYLFYNAKNAKERNWKEQIGIAFSDDMRVWKRYEGNPVIRVVETAWDSAFCSGPFIVHDGGRWVMFYYGYNRRNAQDEIAFFNDLLHWEKYPEPILKNSVSEQEINFRYVHKPSVLRQGGVLYHFYCAVRRFRPGDPSESLWNGFRCITVASSRTLQRTKVLLTSINKEGCGS